MRMKKIKISKAYFDISIPGQLDENGNDVSRSTKKAYRPYENFEDRQLIVTNKDDEKVRVEINTYLKFSNFCKKSKVSEQIGTTAALLEYMRSDLLSRVFLSKTVYFYIPEELDLDWENSSNDLVQLIEKVDLNLEPIKPDLSDEKYKNLIEFYGEKYICCYKIKNIEQLNYLQKLVLKELFFQFTRLASKLIHIHPQIGHRKIKAIKLSLQETGKDYSRSKVTNTLKMQEDITLLSNASFLYEQLYFELNDFVRLE